MHTHIAIKAHVQTLIYQRLNILRHENIHAYKHIQAYIAFHTAPRGHCAVYVACGFKEPALNDIPANQAS